MARRICARVAATVVLCSLFACTWGESDGETHDTNNFRKDVIECEDALDRLKTCCPDFDAAPVLCHYSFDQSSGCGSSSTSSVNPAFTISESSCIRDTSCDALVSTGVCSRAQNARAYTHSEITSTSTSSSGSSGSSGSSDDSRPDVTDVTHPPVCP